MCVLGRRLLKDIDLSECNKTLGGTLHRLFCGNESITMDTCDSYYSTNNVSIVQGIKGLSSGVFFGKAKRSLTIGRDLRV